MLMSRRRRQTDEAGVDISPLIDMVFILLIFFMVTTTFVKDAQVELDRPSASSAKAASTKAIRVTLDRRGDTYVSGRARGPWLLKAQCGDAPRQWTVGSRHHRRRRKGAGPAHGHRSMSIGGREDVAVATEKEAI